MQLTFHRYRTFQNVPFTIATLGPPRTIAALVKLRCPVATVLHQGPEWIRRRGI
jgi:hypothetical protein